MLPVATIEMNLATSSAQQCCSRKRSAWPTSSEATAKVFELERRMGEDSGSDAEAVRGDLRTAATAGREAEGQGLAAKAGLGRLHSPRLPDERAASGHSCTC